jgi:arginase family enzyme
VIPHTTPPLYPAVAPGRFAATIQRSSADLLDRPAAAPDISKCRVALLGLADDTGIELNHGRPGAREGPNAFRAALARYGVASRMDEHAGGAPPYPHVLDAGNIMPGSTIHETHDRVTAAVRAILDLGLFPVGIGGGHDLTFPFVRGVAQHRAAHSGPPIRSGLYVDAHLDVRPEVGSGMPFRALVEHCGVTSLGVIGVEPLVNTRNHMDWFAAHGGAVFAPADGPAAIEAGVDFVSIDLDALDSAFAPGVSAINPCGLSPAQAAGICRAAGRSPRVACFDIMELSPPHDAEGRTARLAAFLFLSFLAGFSERGA